MPPHLKGAAGKKTGAAGRRGGTLTPRAAGPSRGARRCISPPQPSACRARSRGMRPIPVLAAAAAVSLLAAAPAGAATWTAPTTVSAPHTFVSPLRAAPSGNGTAVLSWAFQDGVGSGATGGARAASLLPGAPAFGPERTLPVATTQVVPYAQRSIAGLEQTALDAVGRRVRLSVAFGSAD